MKTLREKCSFIVKLGMTAMVLLFTQHALAAGTTAGTDVDNMATVNYAVGGNPQTEIESSPTGNSTPGASGTLTTFVVDNRVDFTLAQVGGAHTTAAPGETNAFVEFLLTNTGNSTMDFRLVATQLGSADGAVNGLVDTDVDMSLVRVRVGNGGGAPVLGDLDYVDEIAEDDSVTIYIFADAGVLLVDNDVANLELEGTAAAAGLALTRGADLVDDAGSADDPAVIDIVFANGVAAPGLGDGTESDRDGFEIISAALEITKVATVIWDPFNEAVFPKAIPGAIVEYVITVDNTGAEDADNVVITDSIDTDVDFIFDAYAGDDVEIINDGAAQVTPCNADGSDADDDGCALDGQDLTIGDPTDLAITVTAGTLMTITYRVTIP
jgi:uncharacterized repeat protein (TIGR01451 family)